MVKRRTLTREKVIAQANQVIATQGVDQLTIRALAAALDVRPQSIYNYVSSLNDLRDQVGVQFVTDLSATLLERLMGVSGAEALMIFAQVFRQACLDNRHLAPMLLNPDELSTLTKTHDALVKLYHRMFSSLHLEDTGSAQLAENTLYRSVLFGFVMQEIGGFLREDVASLDERFTRTMQLAIDQLPMRD